MDCHEAKDRLVEGRRTAALSRHLERCEDCAAFRREVESGGREVAEAYLARPPSSGFEERVAARLREREISVRPRPARRLAGLLIPAAAILAAVFAWLALIPGPEPVPLPASPEDPTPVARVVPTEPLRENLLYVTVRRAGLAKPTTLDLSFAGEERDVALSGDAEGEFFRAWALGARTADVTVQPRIPGREICRLIEHLEMAGFSYTITRTKPRP
ncbi:MAG: hypothetical protein ABFS86_16810 [Planctomycetota bacterium]